MKKVILSTIIIVIATSLFAQKMTVLDYFEKLPKDVRFAYEIENIEGDWVSQSNADYEIKPVVDIINGYIEIYDEGTGGGTVKLQVVLYRKKDGSALIAVSKTEAEGGVFINSVVKFFEYKNKKWIDVTYKVIPELSYSDFLKKGFDMPDFPEDYYEMSAISYNLPQHGTTIEVSLNAGGLYSICSGDFDALPADKKLVCDFINNLIKQPIKLTWDKTNRKFYQK